MAKSISIKANVAECDTTLTKSLQSGNINFLLGAGASMPAIKTAGNIEAELDKLVTSDLAKFHATRNAFLSELDVVTNQLMGGLARITVHTTISNYKKLLGAISRILDERKTDLLPKQATIFTTNYDLFIERAAESIPSIRLNDGFLRNPSVRTKYSLRPEQFFDVTYKTGSLFKYRFPIPSVNLIKLHGSMSWARSNDEIIYSVPPLKRTAPPPGEDFEVLSDVFANSFEIIIPAVTKFHTTLLTRIYYELLRIFANALEVENTVLVCFGFSFRDEHISDLVRRALKNPTLLLLIVSYDHASVAHYQTLFRNYNNVLILHPDENETIGFSEFNSLLTAVIPKTANG
jgi:hypothetical protein